MSNAFGKDRALETNLSPSRALDGNSANAGSIPAVDTAADRHSDNVDDIANDSPIAPPVQTSRRGFLMNTMVSAASLATAAAVATPPIASATPVLGDVSFPDLVARFAQIHARVCAQRTIDRAWSEKIDKLLFDATGVTDEERRTLEHSDPRWITIDEIHSRLMDEFPHLGPVDDHGVCIAWNQINDELWPVSEAMLDRPAISIADLAWQAEALTTANPELLSPGNQDTWPGDRMLKKLFEHIRTLSGPLAIPSIVPTAQTADPIFAAIEAHRSGLANHSAAVQIECDLERTLHHDKRRSKLTVWEETVVETDDPRWPAAQRCRMDAINAADDAAMALLDIEPASVAGAAALLAYVAGQEDEVFPDDLVDDNDKSTSFGRAIARHVADALNGIRQSA